MILEKRLDVARMKELILQNLWHYQKKHHGEDRTKRWTFIFEEKHPMYSIFTQALVSLQREGLVVLAQNGMCHLTNKGYDHCKLKDFVLPPDDRFFEDY